MIPTNTIYADTAMDAVEAMNIPSGSWQLVNNYTKCGAVNDGLEELKQCIYFMLQTERDQFIVYSYDYGLQIVDLLGQPIDYVVAEIQTRIMDALLMDDRITNVTDFSFQNNNRRLEITFTVQTNLGDTQIETEVEV